MHAKFEDLPLEAHSLIYRQLDFKDRLQMRKASVMWRYGLKSEVLIREDNMSEILHDVKCGKSLLDFTYVTLWQSIDELLELLNIIGNRVIHLSCGKGDFCNFGEMLPNLKTIKVSDSITGCCYPTYKITNIKNYIDFPITFSVGNCCRYLKDILLLQCNQEDRTEWKRVISECNQLEKLSLHGDRGVEFLKMWAINLPATAPLKELSINCSEDFANIFEMFCKKWAHSLESINLEYYFEYYNTTPTPMKFLKHLRALRSLVLNQSTDFARFELYNGIASKINNKLQRLIITETNIDEEELILTLENLPCLRELELSWCGEAVTDRTLAMIFRKLTRLRELRFNACEYCTDAGFLGFGDTPYPISRLSRLTYLDISSFYKISDRILPEISRLKNLRQIRLPRSHFYRSLQKLLNDDFCFDYRKQIDEYGRLEF